MFGSLKVTLFKRNDDEIVQKTQVVRLLRQPFYGPGLAHREVALFKISAHQIKQRGECVRVDVESLCITGRWTAYTVAVRRAALQGRSVHGLVWVG